MDSRILCNFYIESILTVCVAAWYDSWTSCENWSAHKDRLRTSTACTEGRTTKRLPKTTTSQATNCGMPLSNRQLLLHCRFSFLYIKITHNFLKHFDYISTCSRLYILFIWFISAYSPEHFISTSITLFQLML